MTETVTFYELPLHRVDEVRRAAMGMWRARRVLDAVLTSLRQPHAPYDQTSGCYLSSAIGVIGDAPLSSGDEMLGDGSDRYSDLHMDLNEGVGGAWEVIEPSLERIAALDPDIFDVERLQAHYRGALYYYPDPEGEDDEEDEPGLLDEPEDFPAEAGEQIQRAIGVLREALGAVQDDCVLLIRG